MTTKVNLNKIKYMPLSSYSSSVDASNSICAVEVTSMWRTDLYPNWGSKVGLASGTTYTVGSGALASYKAGYIWHSQNNAGNNSFTCYINGATFLGGWNYQDGNDAKLIFFPVSKGDTVVCNSGDSRYFIPVVRSL